MRLVEGLSHHLSYLEKQKYLWELILVNDGSTDKTQQLLANQRKNKNVKLISYPTNKGKGFAIVQGIKKAKGKYILFCDIDHSVPISTIESFFQFFQKNYSVVIGSRRVKGASFVKKQNLLRESLGRGFTLLVRTLIDWKISDATCGFKAFENSIAKKVFAKVSIYDWAFDAEILFILKKYNIQVAQCPVAWTDVKGSKVSLLKDVIRSFLGIVKIRINEISGKYDGI